MGGYPISPAVGTLNFSFGMSTMFSSFPLVLLTLLLLHSSVPVTSLRDDWYGFVSFEDSAEWKYAYPYTCSYTYDLFREPREFSQRDNLMGRRELHTPIAFRSAETTRSQEDATLHIYNNPGIRKAFSVSYGFQRNKECLHGQDSSCVVFPELGRVRALVLNAERFGSEKQNLNFIKDNYLIEKPERFVTILNGGSRLERKFYEAVFLGGYNANHPKRSSHQVDGGKYPLEIYMYFLDETVPSVSLSTILVVSVEESERDNPHIKPIINTVEHSLYDAERRFLESNKLISRRQRLFHHLRGSTYYDVYDKEERAANGGTIIQDVLDTAIDHEAIFSKFVEPFEKMQALEADMFFLMEDHHYVTRAYQDNLKMLDEFQAGKSRVFFPSDFIEYLLMGWIVAVRGYEAHYNPDVFKYFPTCEDASDLLIRQGLFLQHHIGLVNTTQVPRGPHLDIYLKLTDKVCRYFYSNFTPLFIQNERDTSYMENMDNEKKYDFIDEIVNERHQRNLLNIEIFEHVHTTKTGTWHPFRAGDEVPNYANAAQKTHIADGFSKLIRTKAKKDNYKMIIQETQEGIDKFVKEHEFKGEVEMFNIIRYLKYGSKQDDLRYFRSKVHDNFMKRRLPVQQKKRALVELGGMEISEEDIWAYEQLDPVTARVNEAFQISWLIPPDGGYYYYSGSSPIPPCFRADKVILFKKPIKMSRRQIEILTRVPTSFDRSEDIRDTTPYVRPTKFIVELSSLDTEQSRIEEVQVPVYNEPRNHLFLGHDGVHKNAVDEWEKIKKARNVGSTISGGMQVMILIMVIAQLA